MSGYRARVVRDAASVIYTFTPKNYPDLDDALIKEAAAHLAAVID